MVRAPEVAWSLAECDKHSPRRYADATALPIPPSIQIDTMTQLDAVPRRNRAAGDCRRGIALRITCSERRELDNGVTRRNCANRVRRWVEPFEVPLQEYLPDEYWRRLVHPMATSRRRQQGGGRYRPEGPHLRQRTAKAAAYTAPPLTPSWWSWRLLSAPRWDTAASFDIDGGWTVAPVSTTY